MARSVEERLSALERHIGMVDPMPAAVSELAGGTVRVTARRHALWPGSFYWEIHRTGRYECKAAIAEGEAYVDIQVAHGEDPVAPKYGSAILEGYWVTPEKPLQTEVRLQAGDRVWFPIYPLHSGFLHLGKASIALNPHDADDPDRREPVMARSLTPDQRAELEALGERELAAAS